LPSFRHAGGVVPFELLLLTSWAAGTTVRRRREEAEQRLRQAARDADVAVERAQRELVGERLRIARELHDVVAHSISAITVQAGYGRLAVEREPMKAAAALGAIETTGRQTLEELRQLLGVLRTPSSLEPAPVLADLPALLRDVGGPELETELTVVHQPRPLPSGLELAGYRIVQEALTNVVRHSQATRAAVRISYEPSGLRIQITDNGGGANGPGNGSRPEAGHGLVGMRERAALYGGDLTAGPQFGGGFEVTAVLQIPATATLPA
jgi:signal transduction histidine kinase